MGDTQKNQLDILRIHYKQFRSMLMLSLICELTLLLKGETNLI